MFYIQSNQAMPILATYNPNGGIKIKASAINQDLGNSFSKYIVEQKDPRFVYAIARAVTADVPNKNWDYFPLEEIRRAYPTFIGRNIFLDHNTTSVRNAVGKIIAAELREDEEGHTYVACLFKVDRQIHPDIAMKIENGIIDSVSMGANVMEAECSICHHRATREAEFCEHLHNLGRYMDYDHATQNFSINHGVEFTELSLVSVPADPTAKMHKVFDAHTGMKKEGADTENTDMHPDMAASEGAPKEDENVVYSVDIPDAMKNGRPDADVPANSHVLLEPANKDTGFFQIDAASTEAADLLFNILESYENKGIEELGLVGKTIKILFSPEVKDPYKFVADCVAVFDMELGHGVVLPEAKQASYRNMIKKVAGKKGSHYTDLSPEDSFSSTKYFGGQVQAYFRRTSDKAVNVFIEGKLPEGMTSASVSKLMKSYLQTCIQSGTNFRNKNTGLKGEGNNFGFSFSLPIAQVEGQKDVDVIRKALAVPMATIREDMANVDSGKRTLEQCIELVGNNSKYVPNDEDNVLVSGMIKQYLGDGKNVDEASVAKLFSDIKDMFGPENGGSNSKIKAILDGLIANQSCSKFGEEAISSLYLYAQQESNKYQHDDPVLKGEEAPAHPQPQPQPQPVKPEEKPAAPAKKRVLSDDMVKQYNKAASSELAAQFKEQAEAMKKAAGKEDNKEEEGSKYDVATSKILNDLFDAAQKDIANAKKDENTTTERHGFTPALIEKYEATLSDEEKVKYKSFLDSLKKISAFDPGKYSSADFGKLVRYDSNDDRVTYTDDPALKDLFANIKAAGFSNGNDAETKKLFDLLFGKLLSASTKMRVAYDKAYDKIEAVPNFNTGGDEALGNDLVINKIYASFTKYIQECGGTLPTADEAGQVLGNLFVQYYKGDELQSFVNEFFAEKENDLLNLLDTNTGDHKSTKAFVDSIKTKSLRQYSDTIHPENKAPEQEEEPEDDTTEYTSSGYTKNPPTDAPVVDDSDEEGDLSDNSGKEYTSALGSFAYGPWRFTLEDSEDLESLEPITVYVPRLRRVRKPHDIQKVSPERLNMAGEYEKVYVPKLVYHIEDKEKARKILSIAPAFLSIVTGGNIINPVQVTWNVTCSGEAYGGSTDEPLEFKMTFIREPKNPEYHYKVEGEYSFAGIGQNFEDCLYNILSQIYYRAHKDYRINEENSGYVSSVKFEYDAFAPDPDLVFDLNAPMDPVTGEITMLIETDKKSAEVNVASFTFTKHVGGKTAAAVAPLTVTAEEAEGTTPGTDKEDEEGEEKKVETPENTQPEEGTKEEQPEVKPEEPKKEPVPDNIKKNINEAPAYNKGKPVYTFTITPKVKYVGSVKLRIGYDQIFDFLNEERGTSTYRGIIMEWESKARRVLRKAFNEYKGNKAAPEAVEQTAPDNQETTAPVEEKPVEKPQQETPAAEETSTPEFVDEEGTHNAFFRMYINKRG